MRGKIPQAVVVFALTFLISCGGSKKDVQETAAISELTYGLPLSQLTAYEKYNIGKDLIDNGEYEGAAIVFQNLVLKERELFPAYYYLGRVYQKVGYQGDRKKRDDDDDVENFDLASSSRIDIFPPELDGADLAIHMLKKAISLRTDYLPAYSELIRVYLENGEIESALEIYGNATQLDTIFLTTDYRLGFMALKKNKLEEAVTHYREAEGIYSRLYSAYKAFADIKQLEEGADTLALENYEKALKNASEAPDVFEAYFGLAKLHYNVRNNAEMGLKYATIAQQYFPKYEALNSFVEQIKAENAGISVSEGVSSGNGVKEPEDMSGGGNVEGPDKKEADEPRNIEADEPAEEGNDDSDEEDDDSDEEDDNSDEEDDDSDETSVEDSDTEE